jgi:hypothetical protein
MFRGAATAARAGADAETRAKRVWGAVLRGGGGGSFGGAKPSLFTMHAQLVSGQAPNWGFLGAVGSGDLTTTNAVTWSNVLGAVGGDAIISTNDVWTDPDTGDTHLVARTAGLAVHALRRTRECSRPTARRGKPHTASAGSGRFVATVSTT